MANAFNAFRPHYERVSWLYRSTPETGRKRTNRSFTFVDGICKLNMNVNGPSFSFSAHTEQPQATYNYFGASSSYVPANKTSPHIKLKHCEHCAARILYSGWRSDNVAVTA